MQTSYSMKVLEDTFIFCIRTNIVNVEQIFFPLICRQRVVLLNKLHVMSVYQTKHLLICPISLDKDG